MEKTIGGKKECQKKGRFLGKKRVKKEWHSQNAPLENRELLII